MIGVEHASVDVAVGGATILYAIGEAEMAAPPLVSVTPTLYAAIPFGTAVNVNDVPMDIAVGVVRVAVVARPKSEKNVFVLPITVIVQTTDTPE